MGKGPLLAMAWSNATLRLETPACAATRQLRQGQRLRCLRPGTTGTPLAFVDGDGLTGWTSVRSCRQGAFIQGADPCAQCPARQLPADMMVLEVEATPEAMSLKVAYEDQDALAAAYHGFRASGQGPHVRRSAGHEAAAPLSMVDVASLTPRQREALEKASRMGYFTQNPATGVDALAEAMGCSRSTAHEHLRRGLDQLLSEVFS